MVVQHNLTAMNSNRMLGVTTSAQAKSTEKLSSGYKINRAADDAAGLSISEKMRKQIRGLSQASLNAEDGISAVQTAEGALTEVHDMLQRMNELAVKSANGTNSVSDRDAIQAEINQLSTEIDRVAETTKFNETYLLKGNPTGGRENTVKYKTTAISATAAFGADGKNNAITKLYKADGTSVTSAANLNGTETFYKNITSDVSSSNENVQATLDAGYAHQDTDKVYTFNGTDWKDADGTAMANVTVAGTAKVGDTITISAKYGIDRAVSGKDYTYVPGGMPALYDVDGNKISENALDEYFNIDASGTITMKTGKTLYKDMDGAKALTSADFNSYIETKADKAAALDLSLHVGADATLNNQINLKIDAMDAKTLGVAGLRVDGATDMHALNAIETIKAAIQKVSNQRSELGAVQNRLEHTINNLDNVVENTTSAESQIRDTDMATEMVNYSKNQILQQAGQSMLAQANQANQGVLSLLQ